MDKEWNGDSNENEGVGAGARNHLEIRRRGGNAILRGNRKRCLSGMLNPVGQGDVKLRGEFGVSTQTAAPSFQPREVAALGMTWQSQIFGRKRTGLEARR